MSDGLERQMDLLGGQDRRDAADDTPQIRVSARARRLSIRVYADARVECVVPPRARPREIEAFICAHREWIEKRRAIALRHRPEPEVFPPAAIELRLTGEHAAEPDVERHRLAGIEADLARRRDRRGCGLGHGQRHRLGAGTSGEDNEPQSRAPHPL